MSGHNKWSQIKRTKGASDAKRSQMFGKLARMISAQVKVAKGDRNAVLVRGAIEKARAADMPVDTIERAISKATEQKDLESITYEAYGPGGVGIIIEAFTDSRNRAAQEIRHALSKNGFALAGIGSVIWAFQKTGPSTGSGQAELIPTTTVPLSEADSEILHNLVDDLEALDDVQEVITNAE